MPFLVDIYKRNAFNASKAQPALAYQTHAFIIKLFNNEEKKIMSKQCKRWVYFPLKICYKAKASDKQGLAIENVTEYDMQTL